MSDRQSFRLPNYQTPKGADRRGLLLSAVKRRLGWSYPDLVLTPPVPGLEGREVLDRGADTLHLINLSSKLTPSPETPRKILKFDFA